MVKLKLNTPGELNILVKYTELIIKNMLEEHQNLDGAGMFAFFLNGRIELLQHLLRKLKIKQIDMKNKNTINMFDIQAAILIDNNQNFSIDKFGQNVILNCTSEIHRQLINH